MPRLVIAVAFALAIIPVGLYFYDGAYSAPRNLDGALLARMETGLFINPSPANLDKPGTLYEITYEPDGTFIYISEKRRMMGYYRIEGDRVCRSVSRRELSRRCARIRKRSDGGYEARDPETGDVLYAFLLDRSPGISGDTGAGQAALSSSSSG